MTFGLVNVPIKLYTATESKSVSFHEVHVRDGARIEHRRICFNEGREVPYEDVVKGYEVSEGKFVVLDDDEVKAAAGDRGKVVALDEFVAGPTASWSRPWAPPIARRSDASCCAPRST